MGLLIFCFFTYRITFQRPWVFALSKSVESMNTLHFPLSGQPQGLLFKLLRWYFHVQNVPDFIKLKEIYIWLARMTQNFMRQNTAASLMAEIFWQLEFSLPKGLILHTLKPMSTYATSMVYLCLWIPSHTCLQNVFLNDIL